MPRTPLIGVRISWLIVARNCDLAMLAASASRRFASSSASRTTSSVTSRFMPTMRRRPSGSSKTVATEWMCRTVPSGRIRRYCEL